MPTLEDLDPTIISLLKGFGKLDWRTPESELYIGNKYWASRLPVFTALPIFIDVTGSTTLEQRPRMLGYYPLLLANVNNRKERRESTSLRLPIISDV
jgi:hypothetical protein